MVAPEHPRGMKRDREMRVVDRERERSAHLIAVERAVAGAAHPARALPRPVADAGIIARRGVARSVAAEARPSRPVIFAALKALEAEAFVGEPHRPVGVAFAGRDRIAHAGNEDIAHLDLAHQPQRRAVEQNDIDAHGAWAPVGKVGLHFLVAGGVDLPRGPVAVIEAPDAPFIRRHRSGKHDADAVIARRQIDLAHAVPLADFQQLAGTVDAQALHRVAGPAAAIGLARQAAARPPARRRCVLRRRDAGSRHRCGTGETGS